MPEIMPNSTVSVGLLAAQMAWTPHLWNGAHGERTPLHHCTRSNKTTWQPSTWCGVAATAWCKRGGTEGPALRHLSTVWKAQLSVEGLMMLIDLNLEWSLINVICWQLVIINGNANSIIPQGDNYWWALEEYWWVITILEVEGKRTQRSLLCFVMVIRKEAHHTCGSLSPVLRYWLLVGVLRPVVLSENTVATKIPSMTPDLWNIEGHMDPSLCFNKIMTLVYPEVWVLQKATNSELRTLVCEPTMKAILD